MPRTISSGRPAISARDVLAARGDADQARAAAQRRLAGEADRTAHAEIAADREDMTKMGFVDISATRLAALAR